MAIIEVIIDWLYGKILLLKECGIMSFMTPNGLKVRLDAEALETVIHPLIQNDRMDIILRQLETWYNIPSGLGMLFAIFATYSTHPSPWYGAIGYTIIGYLIGEIIVTSIYSNFIRGLIPSKYIIISFAILFGIAKGFGTSFFVLLGIFACSWMGIFSFITMPLNLILAKLRRGQSNVYIGDVERNFMTICNKHAEELGYELDWKLYDKAYSSNSSSYTPPL